MSTLRAAIARDATFRRRELAIVVVWVAHGAESHDATVEGDPYLAEMTGVRDGPGWQLTILAHDVP